MSNTQERINQGANFVAQMRNELRTIKERVERKIASAKLAKNILIKHQKGLDENAQYRDYQEQIEKLDEKIQLLEEILGIKKEE
ncbi:MAG: hypothetical protein Q8N55_03635 [bacterium]|nr:hypothetical protein [bacterium]